MPPPSTPITSEPFASAPKENYSSPPVTIKLSRSGQHSHGVASPACNFNLSLALVLCWFTCTLPIQSLILFLFLLMILGPPRRECPQLQLATTEPTFASPTNSALFGLWISILRYAIRNRHLFFLTIAVSSLAWSVTSRVFSSLIYLTFF